MLCLLGAQVEGRVQAPVLGQQLIACGVAARQAGQLPQGGEVVVGGGGLVVLAEAGVQAQALRYSASSRASMNSPQVTASMPFSVRENTRPRFFTGSSEVGLAMSSRDALRGVLASSFRACPWAGTR